MTGIKVGGLLLLGSLMSIQGANAEPTGGTVNGAIQLPSLEKRAPRPERSLGFSRRVKGPLKEPRRADPRPRMVVVLMEGPVADADAKAPNRAARYELIGESFKTDIFPFVAGSTVEIKNDGHTSPSLYAVGADDAIEAGPVNPRGIRKVEVSKKPFASMEIRGRDSPHLRGALVSMPHTYYSLVGANGSYSITGVPAGKWKVKVWLDGGWLELPSEPSVSVVARRPVKAALIKLPVELKSKPAAESN